MSNFTLKLIALAAMILDHVGILGIAAGTRWLPLFQGMRLIGRMAVPLYAFLLAEGCRHTRDRKKYLFGLIAFAIISEIPYDLFVMNTILAGGSGVTIFSTQSQNVFFTLALAVVAIFAAEDSQALSKGKSTLMYTGVLIGVCMVAIILQSDGSIPMIAGALLMRTFEKRWMQALCVVYIAGLTCIMRPFGLWFLFMCLPAGLVLLYNGQRGPRVNKWLFYWAYPAHLLILALLWLLGPSIFHLWPVLPPVRPVLL